MEKNKLDLHCTDCGEKINVSNEDLRKFTFTKCQRCGKRIESRQLFNAQNHNLHKELTIKY